MAERRGMGEAMALTPEKMAFIQGGLTGPQPVASAAEPSPVSSPQAETAPNSAIAVAEPPSPVRVRPSRPGRSRGASPVRIEEPEPTEVVAGFSGSILVPLTTRLPLQTVDALRRACLEQKLTRRRPNTQQEILEAALTAWLRQQGFLDRSSSEE